MNLSEANESINDNKSYAAVYDELIHVLQQALNGKVQIPVDAPQETVAALYIEVIMENLEDLKAVHTEKVKDLEEMTIVRNPTSSSQNQSSRIFGTTR
jgi:hypothetical protein